MNERSAREALELFDEAVRAGRVGPDVRRAAEAFLFLVTRWGFRPIAVEGHPYRGEASVRFGRDGVVLGFGWSDVDPVAVHLWQTGRAGVPFEALVPAAERAAWDEACDERDFAAIARIIERWAAAGGLPPSG